MKGDYYDDKFERDVYSYKSCGMSLVGIIIVVILSLLLGGCSPNVVTVEKTHTEYVHNTDTLTIKDTVRSNTNTIIREARPEDSLLLAQYGIRLRDNERMLLFLQKQLEQEKSESREVVHDTTIVRDTIPQIVTVEKELSWWDRQKIALEGMLKLLAVGFLFFVFIKLKK
jgi:hypothetical protein